MTCLTLPCRLVGGFLYILVLCLVVGERSVEDKPEVVVEHMLKLCREVEASRVNLANVVERGYFDTHILRDDVSF